MLYCKTPTCKSVQLSNNIYKFRRLHPPRENAKYKDLTDEEAATVDRLIGSISYASNIIREKQKGDRFVPKDVFDFLNTLLKLLGDQDAKEYCVSASPQEVREQLEAASWEDQYKKAIEAATDIKSM